MQFPPSIELSTYIRHYLFLHQGNSESHRLRLFSDGSTGLVVHSGTSLILQKRAPFNARPLPSAFLYGQVTHYQDIICLGPAELFIIVFQPDGLHRLFNIPAGELTDDVIPLSDLPEPGNDRFQNAFYHSNTIAGKITETENFFKTILAHTSPSSNPLITAALSFIQKQKGLVTIEQLANFTGYHPRQLERKFTTAIGLSPKKFCNIIRMHAFLKNMKAPKSNFTQSAYESGYYDQAHLIREFKQTTGFTPSQYLNQTAPLAVNFLQLI